MKWRDEGFLIAKRDYGESDVILEVFTKDHGLWRGLVRGGASRRRRAEFQIGAQLVVTWTARLANQLGGFRAEASEMRAGRLFDDPCALAALGSLSALIRQGFAQGDAHQGFYQCTVELLDCLRDRDKWPAVYALWELKYLESLGFCLDLDRCAATGVAQELNWVSPRTGRAVSSIAAAPYEDRLLPLPGFLRLGDPFGDPFGNPFATSQDVCAALLITGTFLEKWVAPAIGIDELPEQRSRLCALLCRS
jgi:DNA repair protein RecO (recombination protein O)